MNLNTEQNEILKQTINSTLENVYQNDYDLIYVVSKEEIAVAIPNFKLSYLENKIVFSKKTVENRESTDANIFLELTDSHKKEIYAF